MKSISGNKDTDRLILLGLSDRDLLQTCGINGYFRNEVCNDNFFLERLLKTYPDTIRKIDTGYGAVYGPAKSWKQNYLDIIYWISKLKETYGHEYKGGNPKEIYLEKYIKTKTTVIFPDLIFDTIKEKNKDIFKLLLEYNFFLREINKHMPQVLDFLIKIGNLDIIELMMKKGIIYINSILIRAIEKLDIYFVKSFVKYFLEKGYINLKDLDLALFEAAYTDNKKIAKFLIKKGASIKNAKKLMKDNYNVGNKKARKFLDSL